MVLNFSHVDIDKGNLIYILTLNNSNLESSLHLIFNEFLKKNRGLIIHIDINSISFSKLSFLKKIILQFHNKNTSLGIWGIPYCVFQKILGGFYFTLLEPSLIKPNLFFSSYRDTYLASRLHINCNLCIVSDSCFGLGLKKENFSMWNFRLKPEERVKEKKKVHFSDEKIRNKFNLCLDYLKQSNIKYTDRTLKFAKVFTNNKNHYYDNRFVYFCRYLHKSEFEEEKKFCKLLVDNKNYLEFLFDFLYFNYLLKGFAYTISRETSGKYRETFYTYFTTDKVFKHFLKQFGLNCELNSFEEFYDYSVDFVDGVKKSHKVYTRILDKNLFFDYLYEDFSFFLPESIKKNAYNLYFVRRYDENKKLISVKFEFNSYKHGEVIDYFNTNYDLSLKKDPFLREEIFSPDITFEGKLNKFTIYYGNYY